MSIYGWFKGKGPSGFGYSSTAEQVTEGLDLSGRTILVTGCNSGLGLETCRVLSSRGARLIAAARTEDKARQVCQSLGAGALPVACELFEPGSVRACVETVKRDGAKLDAVICNAGIMALPQLQQAYGYELQFFTNHIGHFLLVTGLVDQLAADGRVVMLSSSAHTRAPKEGIQFDNLDGKRGYSGWTAYGQSKLANLLFAKELARRFEGSPRTANAVHPGVIATNLGRHMPAVAQVGFAAVSPLFLKSVAQGAATQCYVATHPDVAGVSGQYFADCNVAEPTRLANDAALAKRLWEESERIVSGIG